MIYSLDDRSVYTLVRSEVDKLLLGLGLAISDLLDILAPEGLECRIY